MVVVGTRRRLYGHGMTTRRYKQGCSLLLLSHFRVGDSVGDSVSSVGAVKLATKQDPALAKPASSPFTSLVLLWHSLILESCQRCGNK